MQIRAAQRNPELRQQWMEKLASYTAQQLVFVDESAANEQMGNRKYAWAPVGNCPHEYKPLQHSERWSILPAYTVDGFMTWNIEHGSFTNELFMDFIEHTLLPICHLFPGLRSVIIMDNAPIHHSNVCIQYIN